jgi:hypothetical protein
MTTERLAVMNWEPGSKSTTFGIISGRIVADNHSQTGIFACRCSRFNK